MHFNGTPAALANLKALEVIAAPVSAKTPKGLLRLVLAVENGAGGLTLRTTHAPLQLAFQKLHLKFERSIDDIAERGVDFSGPVRRIQAADSEYQKETITIPAFNGDQDEMSEGDQALFTAKLGGGFSYVFGVDVDWGDVKNVPEKVYDCIKSTITGSGCSIEELMPEAKVGYYVSAVRRGGPARGGRLVLAVRDRLRARARNRARQDRDRLSGVLPGPAGDREASRARPRASSKWG